MMQKSFSGIGSFLQTPVGVIVATNGIWHIVTWAVGIKTNYIVSAILFGADILIAFYLLDRLIFFFSQFVLPIQASKHRQEIYARVKNFDTGSRGPALFIKNGRVIMHEGEENKRGPGLIVLDTASAAVLRTDTEIKETAGPGVKFTKGNEYIAGSIDLRSQWQYIGPTVNSEQQTKAATRDGADIAATISIKFSIRRPKYKQPTESGVTSQYGYDENAVRKAITHEIVEIQGDEKNLMAWDEFPAYLVVNIWREYVQKFKTNELFAINENGESSLQVIEKMINKRVQQSDVEELDDMGSQTGAWVESREYTELQERGLQITEVRIHNVHFDAATEEQIVSQWNPDWLKSIQQEEKALNETEALIGTIAREEAGKHFARLIAGSSAIPAAGSPDPYKTLQALIKPLKEFILEQSSAGNARNEMEARLRKLDEIWKWLLDNSAELSRSQEGK